MNLKHSSNLQLRKNVLLKVIRAAELCTMPEEDLAPQESKKIIDAQKNYFMGEREITGITEIVQQSRKVK